MQYKNKYNLPQPLVSAIENDPYGFDGDISTTSLILPPRIFQLRKRHGSKIHEDISDNIYRLLGQNTHSILERISDDNCIKEKRYYANICGWKIGGQIDLYEVLVAILSDWKVTSVWSVINGVKPEHEQQLNVNAFLMKANGIHPKKLQIVNFLRDWSKHKIKDRGYPKCQVAVQNIPLWHYGKIEDFIESRVKLHQEQEIVSDNALLPCTMEERWERPTKYAVTKKNVKKALRLLDSQKEAEAWMEKNKKGDSIEVRVGKSIRCEDYCSVNMYCNQYLGI